MRKLVFIASIVFGIAVGLLIAAKEDWGTKVVMIGVALLFCVPIGGALAGHGQGDGSDQLHSKPADWDDPKEMAKNYWRDEGHLPHTKPLFKGDPDQHMLDPDRLS